MAIPYHRYVRYTDDGCGIDECLNCKATWEWRGGSGKVRCCMYCGVEFRGQLECRDSETPRWLYDLKQRLGDEAFYRWESRWWNRPRKQEPYWVLEERSFLLREGCEELLQDWHKTRDLPWLKSAHDAYAELLRVRKEDAEGDDPFDPDEVAPRRFCRYEYRLRRKSAT